MKTLSKAVAVASLISAGFVGHAQAEVEVSASAAVSNMYLWRGQDLGQKSISASVAGNDIETSGAKGVPAVSGDLSVSMGGAYAGVWTSSGDANAGQEYDLFVGYGLEAGDVAVDVSYWTYIYPTAAGDDATDLHEIVASVSTMGVTAAAYYNIDQDDEEGTDYIYSTLGYELDKYSVTYGMTSYSDTKDSDYAHLDLGYAYNDNLSFTVSAIVGSDVDEDEGGPDRSPNVVVTYSLPIE